MPSTDPVPPSGTRMRPYQTQQLAKKIAVRNGWNIASIGDRNGGAAIPDETMPARVKQLGDEARAVPRFGDAILQAFQKAGAQ